MTKKTQQLLNQIVKEIRAFCEQNTDPAVIKKYAYYFKEGYDGWGLSREIYEAGKNQFIETYKEKLTLADALDLSDLLFESGKYEEGSFGFSFVLSFHEEFTPATISRIGKWFEGGVQNWAHTDVICSEVISLFYKNNIIKYEDLSSWRDSSSKWKRRAVPVSLISLVKSKHNIQELLQFVDCMMMDTERVVHQGLGWFLREAWKKEPETVEAFLLKWKNDAARLIFQYATEKMSKEEKERFKREKKA